MKSYFEKMPSFGKALSEQKKEDVENIRNIFEVEKTIDQEIKKAKKAGFPTEKINARGRAILRAITGNLEIPGGEIFSTAGDIGKIIDWEHLEMNDTMPESQRAKQLGADRYPFFGFPGFLTVSPI